MILFLIVLFFLFFFFSSRRRHTRCLSDWSSDVCSSDLDGKRLAGTLSRDGLAVSLEADVHASAPFARWLRSIVPSTQPLLFYDEGYTADIPLTAETTEEHSRGRSWSTDGAPPPTPVRVVARS